MSEIKIIYLFLGKKKKVTLKKILPKSKTTLTDLKSHLKAQLKEIILNLIYS